MPNARPSQAPDRVEIYEVGPRDGLQNEAVLLDLETKLGLVERLAAARPSALEVTSFVRPDRIPQLADADALAAALRERPYRVARFEGAGVAHGGSRASDRGAGVPLAGLVPNLRGYERLRAGGLDVAAVFLSASEGHNRANLGAQVDRSMQHVAEVVAAARRDGLATRGYVSTAFGCPYEGAVPEQRVLELVEFLHGLGCAQVVLGDTIGVAQPRQVAALCERAQAILPAGALGLHMHDTYGAALANVLAGWETGVGCFDAAVGGTGGCPYAPGAAGNLATEDLVSLFQRMGVECGMDLEALIEAGRFLEAALGRRLSGRALRAFLAARASAPAPSAGASS